MAYRVQRGAYSKTSVERKAFSVELSKEKGKRQKIEDKLVYNMQHIAKNVKERKRVYCMRSDSYIPTPVIPAEAGIQRACNYLKTLDSHFHGNDKKRLEIILNIY